MQAVVSFLVSGTGRRLIALVVGVLAVLLNKKIGLGLTTEDQTRLVALIIAYLAGSNLHAAAKAKAKAEESVPAGDLEAASKVLEKGPTS